MRSIYCESIFLSRVEGRGSRVEGRGSRVEGRGSRVEGRGSRVEGRGSRVEGRGSRVEGRGYYVFSLRALFLLFSGRFDFLRFGQMSANMIALHITNVFATARTYVIRNLLDSGILLGNEDRRSRIGVRGSGINNLLNS